MPPLKNTSERYGLVATLLHWLMGLAIIGMLAVGLYMTGLELSPDKLKLYGLHKAIGITLLSAFILRVLWRLVNVIPSLPDAIPAWERWAAHASHFLLYTLMLAMPMTGWLMSSYAGFPVSVFGLFTMPDLVAADKEMAEVMKEVHEWLAYGLIALITVHAGAALKHHFIDKDMILRRMLPW